MAENAVRLSARAAADAPLTVITDFEYGASGRERLAAALAPGQLVDAPDHSALRAELRRHPAAVVLCTLRPPIELSVVAPGVRWVQLPSAGADGAVRAGLVVPGMPVIVTTASGIHATAIAEYVFSSMLLPTFRSGR